MFFINFAYTQLVTQFSQKICFNYESYNDETDMQFKAGQYSNFVNTFLGNFPKYHGQFGHAIATRKITDSLMLLAVGSPWYQGVLIYSLKTVSPTQVNEHLLTELRFPNDQVGAVLDTWQSQNSDALSYNLFGFSITFSKYHILIGSPGDGAGYGMAAKFTGAVVIFPYDYIEDENIINIGAPNIMYAPLLNSDNSLMKLVTKITDSNIARAYDKFGLKVASSKDTYEQFMAVVGNRGWDGCHNLFSPFSNNVVGPYSDSARLGVFVYYILNPFNSDKYEFKQFIPLKGKMPLGDLGFDIQFIGNSIDSLYLSVRDWELNPDNDTLSRGVVYLYKYNRSNKLFDLNPIQKFTNNYTQYFEEDWFGYSSLLKVNQEGEIDAFISAPRNSSYVYVNELNSSYAISNPDSTSRSFFGSNIHAAQNDELLFISDATSQTGAGQVYMYQRYVDSLRYLEGYENVIVNSESKFNLLGIFRAPRQATGFVADQVGADMTVMNNILIAAAPAQGCVYYEPLPLLYDRPPDKSYTFTDNQQNTAIQFNNTSVEYRPLTFVVPPRNKTVYTIFNVATQNSGTGAGRKIQENEFSYYIFGGAIGGLILCS